MLFTRLDKLSVPCLLCILSIAPNLFAQATLSDAARDQIATILADKRQRHAAYDKLDSRLYRALAVRRGKAYLSLPTDTRLASDGQVEVDITAEIDAVLLERVRETGGRVLNAHPRYHAMRAIVPLDALDSLIAEPAVRFIAPAAAFRVRITTEGDSAHGTDTARMAFGVDGTGVSVGLISDSVDALADLQTAGELPMDVTVLADQDGNPGTSEGTALMEIVHDMAPGADLFFATAKGGQAQFAQNILDLAAAGCDVIADDVEYFSEPAFQDGIIAQAVDQVFADGVIYFSAAGNEGNLNKGTSGVYEGPYMPTAVSAPLAGLSAHDYGGGETGNTVTTDLRPDTGGEAPFFTLQWNDPQGASGNDYDLFLLDAGMMNVIGASTNTQDGTQNPYEEIDSRGVDHTGAHLVVVLTAGNPDRFIRLNTHRGMLMHATEGQIYGHPAARGALAVAAVFSNFGTLFDGTESVETFSSDGPRRIFFNADGSPVARGAGGILRDKPDVAAADGVMTATPGFNPFFGTSASAPHAAAISALFTSAFGSIPIGDSVDIFKSSALDIEAPGFDRDSGSGIIMGDEALGTPIFVDGFESGDVSAWTKSNRGAVFDPVSPLGRFRGSFGLDLDFSEIDGLFLRDDNPDGEPRVVARFYVRATDLAIAEGQLVTLLEGHNSAGLLAFRVALRRFQGELRVSLSAGSDGGDVTSAAVDEPVLGSGWHSIQIDWLGGGGAGSMGSLELYMDGAPTIELDEIPNGALLVDSAHFGATSTANLNGSLQLDDYDSRRDTRISTLCLLAAEVASTIGDWPDFDLLRLLEYQAVECPSDL